MLYLDYNGSAPLRKKVAQYLSERLEKEGPYANPNANHFIGSKCLMQIEKTRKNVAKFLDCNPHQVIFNSGSTEGISSVFLHTYFRHKDSDRKIILISDTEHAAPINESMFLENYGFKVVFIPTNPNGLLDFNFLENYVNENSTNIALVCVMAANNETGVIQPYEKIGSLCKKFRVSYLCDTTQIIAKAEFSFEQSNSDFITLSGHKIGALPGVGALVVKNPESFIPVIQGGNQENGLRGGTQNYIGIETINAAIDDILENHGNYEQIARYRDKFESSLRAQFPDITIFGDNVKRICNTSFLSLPNTDASDIQDLLQLQKVFVTTSSACSDQNSRVSRVLSSMGISSELSSGAIRISFCSNNTKDDFEKAFQILKEIYFQINKTY